jgi:hypothetical protein
MRRRKRLNAQEEQSEEGEVSNDFHHISIFRAT